MDKKSGRNDRNEILKRIFGETDAEMEGISRLLRANKNIIKRQTLNYYKLQTRVTKYTHH